MSALTGYRVCVADGDPGVLELVWTRLELGGFQVLPAHDGWAALDILARAEPDALVLELRLPGVDGYEILERQGRLHPGSRRIPTLVLTTQCQPDAIQRALSLGAQDFMCKPFDGVQLVSRVARLLRRPSPRPATSELEP